MPPPGAPEGEARPDDGGKADRVEGGARLRLAVDGHPAGAFEADAFHCVAELLAVLRLVDRLEGRPDELRAEALQHPGGRERARRVERGLAAHGGKQGIGALALDHARHHLRRDRFHVGRVREPRIGHDRRRVGVHQDHPEALVLERLDGLGAGIVELAGLSDDDGAGPDDQDRRDVGAPRHAVSGNLRREWECECDRMLVRSRRWTERAAQAGGAPAFSP